MYIKYLPLLLMFIFFSCAEKNIESDAEREVFVEAVINQQSVVDTSFEGSHLYRRFNQWRSEGPVIPGLLHALVPQGMAFWEDSNLMIISNYMSDDSAGTLSIVDMETEILIKILFLFNDDETPHTGHLGGLAVSRDYLWVASGPGVYYIPLETIRKADDRSNIFLSELIITETKGSFATFSGNTLWIGEFTRENGSYPVPELHHATARDNKSHRGWLAGYTLNADTDMLNIFNKISDRIIPDYILSIPDEIQGALIIEDRILLSASYGRKNYSRLLLFKSPLGELSHRSSDFFPGKNISFWFLDDFNKTGEINMPPMSEAIVEYKDNVAVLFESAASKYRSTAGYPIDRIQFLDLNIFNSD